jgi:hypothetical protein
MKCCLQKDLDLEEADAPDSIKRVLVDLFSDWEGELETLDISG